MIEAEEYEGIGSTVCSSCGTCGEVQKLWGPKVTVIRLTNDKTQEVRSVVLCELCAHEVGREFGMELPEY